MLLIFGLLFSSTVYLSMRLARSLTRPIEQLTAKMKQVENGEFKMADEAANVSQRTDEIGVLQKNFAIMIKKIDTLIKEDYTKQILIKDAQLKALQAQINPHFLYNTLDSINWLAKVNGQGHISAMVESLGNLMRNAISGKEPIITLEEEVQLLKDYLTIQKMRFGERLRYQLDIDREWLGLKVPKLTLQPIVENSINYGLEKTLTECRITVMAVSQADSLKIMVTDNGPGIPEEILEKLAQGEIKPKGSGMGLENIDHRLKLIFGEEYGLCITSELGKGATVTIRIPKGGEQSV
jgi:two-component system sensor histidine kinase YesM